MEMVNYIAIIGSRSVGIELPTSDFDILSTDKSFVYDKSDKWHLINTNTERVIRELSCTANKPFSFQALYPYEFLQENELSKYILDNRENIIRNNLPNLYNIYITRATSAYRDLRMLLPKSNKKRIIYALIYLDSLVRYSSGDISFGEAFKPEGTFKDLIMNIRYNRFTDLDKLYSIFEQSMGNAMAAADFYSNKDTASIMKTIEDLEGIFETKIDRSELCL